VVTEHEHQLREAFVSHEHLAPKLGEVYLGSQELYRKYRRRRLSAQVASGAVVGAGLLAVGTNLPASLLPGATLPGPVVTVTTTGSTTPPVVPTSLSEAERDRDLDAYDRAGYGYDDAVQLAAIWHTDVNLGYVKAEAGSQLLAGRTLPIGPHPDPSDSASPATGSDDAFFGAGYTFDDAVRLAELWKLPDPGDAKVKAAGKLEAGRPLPFPPRAANLRAVRDEAARQKFWGEGYDAKDAERLAALWHVSTGEAKVEAGRRLLAGKTLPI
jgi:hypothetical protein